MSKEHNFKYTGKYLAKVLNISEAAITKAYQGRMPYTLFLINELLQSIKDNNHTNIQDK